MSVSQILKGHYSEETAYLVADYPYGFKLRCKMRCWLEVNKNGTRFCTRTTNPKKPIEVWNAPKKSTYSTVGAMFLDEKGHVQWAGMPLNLDGIKEYLATYREGLQAEQIAFLERFVARLEKRNESV